VITTTVGMPSLVCILIPDNLGVSTATPHQVEQRKTAIVKTHTLDPFGIIRRGGPLGNEMKVSLNISKLHMEFYVAKNVICPEAFSLF